MVKTSRGKMNQHDCVVFLSLNLNKQTIVIQVDNYHPIKI